MLNVTRAVFCHSDSVQTTPLYQWDYGQILLFEGIDLPANFEVNFSNTPMSGSSLTVFGTDNQVNIPSSLLETGKDIWCWVFLHDTEADGETKYTVTIPVIARAMRDGTEPTPEQQDAIGTAIEALNDATEVLEEATTQTEGYRDQAEGYATQAESWAIGGTDTRQGEDTDNAKYYAEQTAQTAEAAIQDIQTEGTAQIGAIEAKGNAVRESIPSEYSDFYDEFVVNRGRVFGEIFGMSGAITERVEDGTLLKNQIMANKICSLAGYCFDSDEGKVRLFGIFGSFPPTGGTNRSYNLFCFDSPDAPYELTLENAPMASQIIGAVDVYKVRTNVTIPGPNVTDHFDHRYCRVLYDKDGNEVERHYSAQYRFTLNNGVVTRSRLMTEPQDPALTIDIGLYTCSNSVPQTFTWPKQDRTKAVLKPLVSTNQTAQYRFIVPDSMFTNQYGLAMTAVGGDWVEYVGAQFFPAPIPPDPLPSVTSSDNGKVLSVVDGEWSPVKKQGVNEFFDMSSVTTKRVEEGTLLTSQITANKICACVGYYYDAVEQKLRLYNFFGNTLPSGYTEKSYYLRHNDSAESPYELTLENAPQASLISGSTAWYKYRLNASFPGNATDHFDFRLCRVIYDSSNNEVDRFYSAQYRYTLTNGAVTRSRFETATQDEDLIVDVGLYVCEYSTNESFAYPLRRTTKIDLKSLVGTNEGNDYRFIIPDDMFTGQHGLAITAVSGDWTEYVGAQFSPAPRGNYPVAVSGTDPVVVAEANTRYVCGEIATLSFTAPLSGICDIRFTSGATPTVCTWTNVTLPSGFTVEANKVYEVNILDGLAVVQEWTAS